VAAVQIFQLTVKVVILKERAAKIQLFSLPRKGRGKRKFIAKVPELAVPEARRRVEGPTEKAGI